MLHSAALNETPDVVSPIQRYTERMTRMVKTQNAELTILCGTGGRTGQGARDT